MSACAEFLLPAANKIIFIQDPMIGFHWSPILNENEYVRASGEFSKCDLSDYEYQKNLHRENQLNEDFWLEVEKRLVLQSYKVGLDGCNTGKRKFKNTMWLPTSQQLKNLLGLKFEGKVCSDDLKACKMTVNQNWKKGKRVVIGDTVHISEGPDVDCSLNFGDCEISALQKFMKNVQVISPDLLVSSSQ